MTNELTVKMKEDEYTQTLRDLTGENNNSQPFLPSLKFDGAEGVFKKSFGERDEEGKPIYDGKDKDIKVHILSIRRRIVTAFGVKPYLYAHEIATGNSFDLIDAETKIVVDKGSFKDLKAKYPDLKYEQVLYVVDEAGQGYRMILGGSKLNYFFSYMQSFGSKDSIANYYTVMTCGDKKKKGSVTYYELLFKKENEVERKIVIERIKSINDYFKSLDKNAVLVAEPDEDDDSGNASPEHVPFDDGPEEADVPMSDIENIPL